MPGQGAGYKRLIGGPFNFVYTTVLRNESFDPRVYPQFGAAIEHVSCHWAERAPSPDTRFGRVWRALGVPVTGGEYTALLAVRAPGEVPVQQRCVAGQ